MRTGNHTLARQHLYLVANPTLAIPAALLALIATGSPALAAWAAAWTMLVKIGVTGRKPARFASIAGTSPGPDIPVSLGRVWGAYYIEQFLHRLFFFLRIRWFGSGKTEWFMGLPGLVALVAKTIIQAL